MIKPGITIGLDFDGTVVTHEYPDIGKPLPYCIETLKKINDAGGLIILNTMRSGSQLAQAVDYLIDNGIKLHGVNKNPTQHTWTTSPKVHANIYIDDAALGSFNMRDPNFSDRDYIDWVMVDAFLFPEEY